MIIKADHVAWSATDIDAEKEHFRALGYREVFHERDKANAAMKAPLLQNFQPLHAACLMEKPGSYPVELLDHGHVGSQSGFLQGLFETDAALPAFAPLNAHGRVVATAPDFRLDTLACASPKPEESVAFWRLLGFQPTEPRYPNFPGTWLSLQTPLQATPLYLLIEPADEAPARPPRLDDGGFPCLALVSTSIEGEKKKLAAAGFAVTGNASLVMDGKQVTFCFAVGPCGELAEIIHVKAIMP